MEYEKENIYKTAAQNKKVAAMVEAIDRAARAKGMCEHEDAGTIADRLKNYPESSWIIVDRVAKLKHVSSAETRRKVIQVYEQRALNAPF